jgi:anaerobic selenocysteine-containing dehydrogenase
VPEPGEASGAASPETLRDSGSGEVAPDASFKLGTYRDLWVGSITELNPPLRFLAPQQRVEMAVSDVERLGLKAGDEVRVSQNGTSVQAKVDPRERVTAGVCFLIEGTKDGNANALLNGSPVDVTIEKVGD